MHLLLPGMGLGTEPGYEHPRQLEDWENDGKTENENRNDVETLGPHQPGGPGQVIDDLSLPDHRDLEEGNRQGQYVERQRKKKHDGDMDPSYPVTGTQADLILVSMLRHLPGTFRNQAASLEEFKEEHHSKND